MPVASSPATKTPPNTSPAQPYCKIIPEQARSTTLVHDLQVAAQSELSIGQHHNARVCVQQQKATAMTY